MTFFPWERMGRGRPGVGETSLTQFAVPAGSLPFWRARLEANGALVSGPADALRRGAGCSARTRTACSSRSWSPADGDEREPWTTGGIEPRRRDPRLPRRDADPRRPRADRGPAGGSARLRGGSARRPASGATPRAHARHARSSTSSRGRTAERALQGRGSVHHIAFAVADRAAQLAVRERLVAAGHGVTPVIDRNYFYSIYFRSPGGVLFEIATAEPGFTVDEPAGRARPATSSCRRQHEHLRAELERILPPLAL